MNRLPVITDSNGESELQYVRKAAALQRAARLYSNACIRHRLFRFWSWLQQKPYQLINLELIRQTNALNNIYSGGIQEILIRKIMGSESRSEDFDRYFNPTHTKTRERWINVARLAYLGDTLPPVDLIQVGDAYFVRDGHHRVSVFRALGQSFIDAEVTVWNMEGLLPWQRVKMPHTADLSYQFSYWIKRERQPPL